MGPQNHCRVGGARGVQQRESERGHSLWELWGSVEGPRGEILTPATMGGEQKRETASEIMDECVREREMGMN